MNNETTVEENCDYEAVPEEELEDDDDADQDDEVEEEDPDYLNQNVPLSAVDVDIKIVRQKMSFAEAAIELLRVSECFYFTNIKCADVIYYYFTVKT